MSVVCFVVLLLSFLLTATSVVAISLVDPRDLPEIHMNVVSMINVVF